jgi:hypothetical protein
VAATKVSGARLDLTTYPSDAAVASGNRFSLVLDIKPCPGIHLYAPGANGYRAIALSIAPRPDIRVLAVQFPRSQIYFQAPERACSGLPEAIHAGAGSDSRWQQAQAALRGKENLPLTGTLDYQLCDDKQCFNPASVPLSWALALKK